MQTRQRGLEGTGEITLRDLVQESLRMRPSRVIVGEVRSEECLDLLLALNAGLPGMATLHANSAREALVKMCTLPLLAGENISARFVVPTVAASVDLVVHLGIDADGVRRVNEIVAVPGRVENDIDRDRAGLRPRRDAAGAAPPGCRRGWSVSSGRASTSSALLARAALTWARCSGSALGVGLLLIWVALTVPHAARRPARRGRIADLLDARGAGRHVAGSVVASASVCARRGRPGRSQVLSRHGAGRAGLRRDGRLPAARGAERPCPAPAAASFAEVWPEAVDNLASAVRAGMSLPEALVGSAERGPEPLREAFPASRPTTRSPAASVTSLDRLKDRLADPVGDRVVEGLRIAREVGGGDLGRLLRSLLRLPARGRPHPRRARVAAGVDGQRRPAGGRRAVAGAADAVLPAPR